MTIKPKSEKVPKKMEPTYQKIVALTDEFCEAQLNEEYAQLARQLTATLCRKRPSPLARGRANSWACGIIYYAMVFHGIPWEVASLKDVNFVKYVSLHSSGPAACGEPFYRLPCGPRNLLHRILDPDPETRISMEELLENEWFKKISVCCNDQTIKHTHLPLQ